MAPDTEVQALLEQCRAYETQGELALARQQGDGTVYATTTLAASSRVIARPAASIGL